MNPQEQVKICPCCNNYSHFRLAKGVVNYYQCESCKTLFSDPLENSNMVGGGNEEQRNVLQNSERIARVKNLLGSIKSDFNILDFGCGHARLVKDLNEAGFTATGYDVYNPEYSRLPIKNNFHACTMIEVIEHLSAPFVELDVIHRSLLPGGVLVVETSFVDVAKEENIPLEDFFYIDPTVGHSTIFSHHGIDVLMSLKGFKPFIHFNRHCRCYTKR